MVTFHRRQGVGIAGQEPTSVWLSAVYRDAMSGKMRRFPADVLRHGQRVPAPRVSDFADNYDLFQFADATNPRLLVGGQKRGRKSIPPEWRLARIEKHDIVRHECEQADKIAGINGLNPR